MKFTSMLGVILLFHLRVNAQAAPVVNAQAAPVQVTCPDSVSVKQELTSQIDGWKVANDSLPHRLRSITFFDGPPEEEASLVYDAMGPLVAGKETAVWHFGPGRGRLIWASCGYSGTSIILSKSLPASLNSCSVTYNARQKVGGNPLIEKITCK